MGKVLEITKLLGEENEKKLKDSITDLMIEKAATEIDDMCDYLIDFERLFDEVQKEVSTDLKEKLVKIYSEKLDVKIKELF